MPGSDLVVEPVEVAERVQVLACDGEPEAFAQHLVLAASPQGPAHLPLHRLEEEHTQSGHGVNAPILYSSTGSHTASHQPIISRVSSRELQSSNCSLLLIHPLMIYRKLHSERI